MAATAKKRRRQKTPAERVEHLTQQLGEKLEQAMDQLTHHPIKVKVREKQLEYDQNSAKLLREMVEEREKTEMQEGDVDIDSLRKLAAALKDWISLHPDSTDAQREEQLQRVLARLEGLPAANDGKGPEET